MSEIDIIRGFSKLSKEQKIELLAGIGNDLELPDFLNDFRIHDSAAQQRFEGFSENTLSNYHLPWGLVPNVVIDGQLFHVPVVTEESSVVAAASKAASFWAQRGGFKTLHTSTIKKGQLHFLFYGDNSMLMSRWDVISTDLLNGVSHLIANMEKRGGGIKSVQLKSLPALSSDYFQIDMEAETRDSMGANFINTVLEEMGRILPDLLTRYELSGEVDVLMAILSNHTPDCVVKMELQAPVNELTWTREMAPEKFASRMKWAADIAWHDTARAVTHNKGIYNGVDAVVLATGNDFRAVEAAGHAYACVDGQYRALSRVDIDDDVFTLSLELPLALGTVGGLTRLHPLAAKSIQLLGNPDATTLMKIAAALGVANNFAAMASLVTTGIQQGHMKMHLKNILNALQVDERLHHKIADYFHDKTISVTAVREYVATLD